MFRWRFTSVVEILIFSFGLYRIILESTDLTRRIFIWILLYVLLLFVQIIWYKRLTRK